MKVIDVNGWRECPNLALAQDKISGIIIKVSEGRTLDEDFERHLDNAVKQGVPIGVYCYSHAKGTDRAAEEARIIVDKLKEYPDVDLSLGVWYDMEDGNIPDCSPFEVAGIVMAFINEITDWRTDIPVGLYSGYYCLCDSIDVDALADYVQLWVANYALVNYWNEENPDRPAMLWQYSESYPIGDDVYDIEEWYNV